MNPLSILRDAWNFYIRHLGAIARLCLPLICLESLAMLGFERWRGTSSEPLQEVLLGLLFYPIYNGALILYLDARSRGLSTRDGDLLAQSLRLWPRLALLTGLSTLLVMLGASLMLLPGIWVMVKLAFADYLLVLRGLAPLEAVKESFRLSRGHFLPILLCVLVVTLPFWLLDGWLHERLGEHPELLANLLLDAASSFLQLFGTVTVFRLFMLREAEPEPQ